MTQPTLQWPPEEVKRLEKSLDQLIDAVSRTDERSDDDQMWLARFLVIRSCGYLEQVVIETISGYLQRRSFGMVRSFSLSGIPRSQNPTPDNLLDMVGRLDHSLRVELEDFVKEEEGRLARDLHFLVNRRNLIAHGKNEGLGTRRALDLARASKAMADWFILRLNPGW